MYIFFIQFNYQLVLEHIYLYNKMPFCKMCFDLGRPDFDKHNVRDAARNTTCPYLLNYKCRNCGYYGHTSSYCKMSRNLNPTPHKPPPKHITIVKPVFRPTNVFEHLECHNLDDEVSKQDDLEFPDLSKVQWGKGFLRKSWADEVDK